MMKYLWSAKINLHDILKNITSASIFNEPPKNHIQILSADLEDHAIVVTDVDPEKSLIEELIIIVKDEYLVHQISKFIAIPGSQAPISSSYRFWDEFSAKRYFSRKEFVNSKILLAGFTGLVTAEMLVKFGTKSDLRVAGLSIANRMLSYSCAKLSFAGGSEEELYELSQAWLEASLLTNNEADSRFNVFICYLSDFISSLSRSYNYDYNINSLGKYINELRPTGNDLFDKNNGVDISNIETLIKSTNRENRIHIVESAISQLKYAFPEDEYYKDLVSGYLVTLIDPGSLDFFDLALKLNDGAPRIACAYATCTSLMSPDSAKSRFSGFGKSIFGRLVRPKISIFDSVPDLGLHELKILNRLNGNGYMPYRTHNASVIEVELIPGITGSFLNVAKKEANSIKSESNPYNESYSDALITIDHLENTIFSLQKFMGDLKKTLNKYPNQTEKKKSVTASRSKKKFHL